jgi:dTDP-glucose 4,6-dehydratase/UDP-glucuronate decarboxylase
MAHVVVDAAQIGGLRQALDQEARAIARAMEPALRPLQGGTLLVTGGAGFVCSYFVETVAHLNAHAWERSCRVVCVDNLITGQAHRLAHLLDRPDIRFLQHDVSTPLRLPDQVQWIIHGAGIASPMVYRQYPLETIAVNVQGTQQVLDLAKAHEIRSMVYLSSSEIYGDPPAEWIPTPEEYRGSVSCTGPRACYDESKRLAETLCLVYHRRFGLPVNIVRPFNMYGPGQRLDDGRIVPDLIAAAARRQPLVLYSDGRATRAFCYIRDAICAMWWVLMADRHGEVFNVGNDQEEVSMHAVAQRVRDLAGPPWLPVEQRISQDPDYLTDNPSRRCPNLNKLRASFPWTPTVSLVEGLRMTLDAYRGMAEPAHAS